MWKIDNRLSFLIVFNSLKDEYKHLALHIVSTAVVITLLFGYVPNTHLIIAMFISFVLFMGRWRVINYFLSLEDIEDDIPISSELFKSYLMWFTVSSLFLSTLAFYSFDKLPAINQNMILFTLIVTVLMYNISLFSFFNAYLMFSLPILVPTLYFIYTKSYYLVLLFSLFAIFLSILSLMSKKNLINRLAKAKVKEQRYKEQINKEAKNLKEYIDLLDELDIATVLVDNKNRILYHSLTLQKWFNVDKNMSFDRFFASIIRDINELNKKEIVSKSGRTYKIASNIIEDIDNNMYYLKVFKDTTKEYKYNKASFRENLLHPDLDEYDKMTKLLRKEPFFKYLEQAIYEANITLTKVALVIIDINNFEYINETYGDKVGNEVLRILSKRLKNSTRDSDLVGRYGDDELIVALKLIEDITTVEVVARKILKNLIRPFRIVDDKDIFITVNIGISLYPDNTKNLDKLVEQADKALQSAKRKQQNGYLLYRDIAIV